MTGGLCVVLYSHREILAPGRSIRMPGTTRRRWTGIQFVGDIDHCFMTSVYNPIAHSRCKGKETIL